MGGARRTATTAASCLAGTDKTAGGAGPTGGTESDIGR